MNKLVHIHVQSKYIRFNSINQWICHFTTTSNNFPDKAHPDVPLNTNSPLINKLTRLTTSTNTYPTSFTSQSQSSTTQHTEHNTNNTHDNSIKDTAVLPNYVEPLQSTMKSRYSADTPDHNNDIIKSTQQIYNTSNDSMNTSSDNTAINQTPIHKLLSDVKKYRIPLLYYIFGLSSIITLYRINRDQQQYNEQIQLLNNQLTQSNTIQSTDGAVQIDYHDPLHAISIIDKYIGNNKLTRPLRNSLLQIADDMRYEYNILSSSAQLNPTSVQSQPIHPLVTMEQANQQSISNNKQQNSVRMMV